MSYFDHVRCHACNAVLDPDTLGPGKCPRCGVTLSLTDLFGVSAAFSEDDEPHLTLDDLVSGPRPSSPPAGLVPGPKRR